MKHFSLIAILLCISLLTSNVRAETLRSHDASMKLKEAMETSNAKMNSMQMSDDVDQAFATMMAEHHRSAVAMAQVEVEQGKNEELKALAKKIITSQKEEIKVLENHASMQHH